ncbi:helix-turn-helix transcriptional regulator [Paenilisteria rocourtiae]|uniref:Putative DNA-binding transcriptional regulator YafY n=1 Tax=Listeria rocourtiae TaxID=647910 RepID=A0A4R6ZN64_9LIST|nr:YafY family protein [Listeria rocourtiae]EUJ44936.1 DeoR family transcriptional regulator [Listeria rocourtiae FSL F6-920]TDR53549.1 putative DNA-binding transcriptional regulator YafY [Listeria rocourtiae]
MKIDRLLEILILLMNRKQVQAKELAAYFEVSVRTIYRDIETLSIAGIPIEMTRGRAGGISLMKEFSLSKIPITAKEKDVLQVALQNLSTTNFPELATLTEKLQALWHTSQKEWIAIDSAEYGSPPERNEIFETMKRCILENHKISFIYYNSSRQKTRREVAPLKLWYRGSAWYLWGYCYLREAYRLFHIHRMVDMAEIGYFRPDYDESAFEIFRETAVTPAPRLVVHLVFEVAVYYRLLAIFPTEIMQLSDNRIVVKTEMPKTDWLYSFLLSFGSDVQIIAPESLRLEIKANLQKAMQHHG